MLAEAASQAGCKAFLGLLTFWESGSAEDDYDFGYGYGSRRRRYWEEEPDEDESEDEDEDGDDASIQGRYTMEEVFDSSLTIDRLSDRDGQTLPIGELPVTEDEVLDTDALQNVKPEEQYEGYTGNEGMTLERWYRHAAILIWPERRHFDVLCTSGSRNVVPVLAQLVAGLNKAGRRGRHAQGGSVSSWPARS